MKPLVREALLITEDLGRVVFIGAIARYFHTRVYRESTDLDFAVERPIEVQELNGKGYNQFERNGKLQWFTPRGVKIDIYTRDVSGIPIEKIMQSSKEFPVGKTGESVRVMSLESLVVSKHRAQRAGDVEDLQVISSTRFKEIRWDALREITRDAHEFDSIRSDLTYLSKYW